MPAVLFNPFTTSFAAVFRTEVLLNLKRPAPYVLFILFTANSVFWFGWSAAATYGWEVNSEYNIVRNLQGFSWVLGMPIFNAVIMGDAVTRDFRLGVDPLLFSKPVGRASYLFGKFFGNFFVLVCCQSAFVLTMFVLQFVPFSGLSLREPHLVLFFKPFFFFVVISHLLLAAIYFAAGTLTRNSKIVYGLAVGFYPLYISWMVFVVTQLPAWRVVLDPIHPLAKPLPDDRWTDVAFVNQIVINYTTEMILNRGIVIATALIILVALASRFSFTPRTRQGNEITTLNLSDPSENVYYSREALNELPPISVTYTAMSAQPHVALPGASLMNDGCRATARKLRAALLVEWKVLRSERTLIVFLPLTALLSFLALPFSAAAQGPASYAFAAAAANGLLLFLLGVICFYTGEAMARDRELRVEPLLWSTPASDVVLLFSKMLATLGLALFLVLIGVVTTIVTQILRGQTPIDILVYISIYTLILIPTLIFMTAACTALTTLLRDKYLTYVVVIALSGGLLYLYKTGYNHWLYNPAFYDLWSPGNFQSSTMLMRLIALRGYTLGLAFLLFLIAHLCFSRQRSRKFSLI